MLHEEDYSSDTSDEDFVPKDADIDKDLSEEESGGDEEEEEYNDDIKPKSKKRKRKQTQDKPNKKVNPLLAELGKKEEKSVIDTKEENKLLEEEKKKERASNLWANFLADVEDKPAAAPKPKARSWGTILGNQSESKKENPTKESTATAKPKIIEKPSTVKVTKVFEFAGEEVRLTEEVPADTVVSKPHKSHDTNAGPSLKKGLCGASGILNMIDGKKKKLSVLEKTKMDWNNFKNDEGLQEELELHKKSKFGYLDKQAFLERADHRQFEIEKSIREINRSKQ